MMSQPSIRAIFFDLGDTLVRAASSSPSGITFAWVQGAKELIRELRQAGFSLGVVSNTGTLSRSHLLEKLPSDFNFDLFDSHLVLLSSEVKLEKPDPKIFRLAIHRAQDIDNQATRLSIDPWNCLFCGEALLEVLAAQRVGMVGARVQLRPQPDIGRLSSQLREVGLIE